MKLTTKSEYSLLALIYLARHEKDSFVKVEDICDRYSLSKKYLEQFLTVLKSNRFVESKRSKTGGYRLAVPSKQINIADIVRLMDGALAPDQAVSKYFYSKSPIEKEKKLLSVLRDIREYTAHKLENLSLADLT